MDDLKGWTIEDPPVGAPKASTGAWKIAEATPAPQPGAMSRFGNSFLDTVLPSRDPKDILRGPAYAVQHPLDAAKLVGGSLLQAQGGELDKAKAAASQGNWGGAIGHGLGYALPVVGPVVAHAGDQMASGDIAGGLGTVAGVIAPVAAGEAISSAKSGIARLATKAPNDVVPRDLVVAATKPSKNALVGLDEHIGQGFPDVARVAADQGINIKEMPHAVEAADLAKKNLWTQYEVGRSPFNDVPINPRLVRDAILSTISDKMLADKNQAAKVSAIRNLAQVYDRQSMPLVEADGYLKELNQELAKAKYFDKTPEAQYLAESQPSLEAKVAEAQVLRHIVRDTLTKNGGPELAALRDRFGAVADLKELFQSAADKDVVAKAEAASMPLLARASNAVAGIAHNPIGAAIGGAAGAGLGGFEGGAIGAAAGGLAEGGARAIAKRMTSPDYLISKAFDVYNPRSYPPNYMPKLTGNGMPQLGPGGIYTSEAGPQPMPWDRGMPLSGSSTPTEGFQRNRVGQFPELPPGGFDPDTAARDFINYMRYSPHEVTEHTLRQAASQIGKMANEPGIDANIAQAEGLRRLFAAEQGTGGKLPQLRALTQQILEGPTKRAAALARGSEQPPPYAAPLEAQNPGIIRHALSRLDYNGLEDLQKTLQSHSKDFPNLSQAVDELLERQRRSMLH